MSEKTSRISASDPDYNVLLEKVRKILADSFDEYEEWAPAYFLGVNKNFRDIIKNVTDLTKSHEDLVKSLSYLEEVFLRI